MAQRLWDPVVQIFRPIPPLAFLPMFILYLGIGELTRVLFIAYSVYFYTYMSAMQGVRHVDPLLIRAALSLGASQPPDLLVDHPAGLDAARDDRPARERRHVAVRAGRRRS